MFFFFILNLHPICSTARSFIRCKKHMHILLPLDAHQSKSISNANPNLRC